MKHPIVVLVLFSGLAIAACSGSSTSSDSDASADADANDAAGMADSWTGCSEPPSAYCASNPCDTTIAAACPAQSGVYLTQGCAGLDVLTFSGIDGDLREYFDATTGKLVALVSSTANFGGSAACLAGPASFVPPTCSTGSAALECPDAAPRVQCVVDADCPQMDGGTCHLPCVDGTDGCTIVCVKDRCLVRGCPASGPSEAGPDTGPETGLETGAEGGEGG